MKALSLVLMVLQMVCLVLIMRCADVVHSKLVPRAHSRREHCLVLCVPATFPPHRCLGGRYTRTKCAKAAGCYITSTAVALAELMKTCGSVFLLAHERRKVRHLRPAPRSLPRATTRALPCVSVALTPCGSSVLAGGRFLRDAQVHRKVVDGRPKGHAQARSPLRSVRPAAPAPLRRCVRRWHRCDAACEAGRYRPRQRGRVRACVSAREQKAFCSFFLAHAGAGSRCRLTHRRPPRALALLAATLPLPRHRARTRVYTRSQQVHVAEQLALRRPL